MVQKVTMFIVLMILSSTNAFLTNHEFLDNDFYSKNWKTYIFNGNLKSSHYYYNFHYR